VKHIVICSPIEYIFITKSTFIDCKSHCISLVVVHSAFFAYFVTHRPDFVFTLEQIYKLLVCT